MSKLQDLINELCPHGVEYMTLGEIATDIYRGNGIKRDEITEDGIPCVRYGEIYTTYGIWFDKCVSHTYVENVKSPKYFEYGDILFAITGEKIEDIAKSCAYIGQNKCLAGGDIVILKHSQNPKYLSYALSTTEAQTQKSKGKVKSKVVHSSVPSIKEIIVPVPPLEVQQEIVNILDRFSDVKENLINELTQELENKKTIFEHSRDKLLVSAEYKIFPLAEIAHFTYGYTDKAQETGNARFIRITDILDNGCLNSQNAKYVNINADNKKYLLNKGDILMARTGATYGKTLSVPNDEPSIYASFLIKIDLDNSRMLNRFYWHFAQSSLYWKQANKLVSTGGQPQFNSNAVCRVNVPVPPLAEQERIVTTLDRLTETYNAVTDGIQKEIEQIEKIYTYCTDKLLTFKAVSE